MVSALTDVIPLMLHNSPM